jgi:hypothetical protein
MATGRGPVLHQTFDYGPSGRGAQVPKGMTWQQRPGVVPLGNNRFGYGPGGAQPTPIVDDPGVPGGKWGGGIGIPLAGEIPQQAQSFAFSVPNMAAPAMLDVARLAGRAVVKPVGPMFDLTNDKAFAAMSKFRAMDVFAPGARLPQMYRGGRVGQPACVN